MKKVLLTNAQHRKTLAAVRSLGSRGIKVIVSEETRMNPSGFSRYCSKSLVSPNPKDNPYDYFTWLLDTITSHDIDIIIPMDDDTLEIIMEHRNELERLCHIPLPPSHSYYAASDKGTSTFLANEAGLDCPDTIVPKSLEELSALTKHMSFPVVVKPRKSSGSRGIRIINRRKDLESVYSEVHQKYPFPIIQEYIGHGDRYDVCLLFNAQSQLRASFVQKELRHFPLEMGPSTLQESVLYPELVEKSTAFISKLGWFGVIELEFMMDNRDGKLKFLEINPRFWNSLYLSVLCGIDFPWLLYRLATEGDIEDTFNYEPGIRCRWSLPGDILHFVFNKDRFKMVPPIFNSKKYRVYDDIISWEDPFPTLGFFLACIRYVFDRKMWNLMFKR